MSAVLKLSGGAELPLAAVPEQVTVFADGQSRVGYKIQIMPSNTMTAESVNALVSDSAKTSIWDIVNDGTVAGTYSNYTVLADGVTLINGVLVLTLCKRTDTEIQIAQMAADMAALGQQVVTLSLGGN